MQIASPGRSPPCEITLHRACRVGNAPDSARVAWRTAVPLFVTMESAGALACPAAPVPAAQPQ